LLSSLVVISSYLIFAVVADSTATTDLARLSRSSLSILGWGTTLGVLTLALSTMVPMTQLGLRLRPRLRFAPGDRAVIARIAAAAIGGLVLQQLSLLLINWSAQQTGDQGALTRFTWANAIYLLPYAVLVAPLLQLTFPRLSTAAAEGDHAVAGVLSEVGPQVIILAGLGAALLVATAVPVARVFVLGPGSGDTVALAWPIAALAPAVIGFGVLGLASRTLLAQRRARAAGAVTMTAWGVVILAVLGLQLVVPAGWVVVALAASVSLGMCAGALVGMLLTRATVDDGRSAAWLGRSVLVCLLAAAVAGGVISWPASLFRDSGLVLATVGAVGAAIGCLLIFVVIVFAVDRRLLAGVWSLVDRRRTSAAQS
jgi:putative peptidoglycan lipid II flippase